MEQGINKDRLFLASCVALITTAMTFAIRAGILTELGETFAISDYQLGWVNSMAFLGFPIAMMVGGLLYNEVGPKKMMWAAFISHLLGLVLTITAGGFWGLIISTFFIGFANGAVEAACNPLIAGMYKEKQTTMLNKFHVWFPGGIVIGSLVSGVMGDMGWQAQIAIMLIPTVLYAYLIWGQKFPTVDKVVGNTAMNIKSLANPLFIFMALCMTLTAATEFSTTQWVEKLLKTSGASPMAILALVTGLMAVGRYFAGPIIHRLNPAGVLLASAVIATLGVYMFSVVSGPMVYVAAITFAIGICYFWPTMIGFTGEYLPKTGALGMSLVGGAGMFSMSIWNPVIGGWLDDANARALEIGATGVEAEIVAGQEVLSTLSIIPMILIGLFAGLYFYMRGRGKPADEVMLNPDAMATPGSGR